MTASPSPSLVDLSIQVAIPMTLHRSACHVVSLVFEFVLVTALDCVDIDKVNKRRFPHPTGNQSPPHEAVEYVTRDPVTKSTSTDADDLPTATDHLQRESRICDNQTLIMSVVCESYGKPVDPEVSKPESENDEDNESTEQDHEDS